jgi:undecaprenyl diphosphate synthase
MALLRRFIRKDLADLHKSNVRVRIIGEREGSIATSACCCKRPKI